MSLKIAPSYHQKLRMGKVFLFELVQCIIEDTFWEKIKRSEWAFGLFEINILDLLMAT